MACSEVPAEGFGCGNPCGRLRDCGRHKCEAPCHAGPCAPCAEQVLQTCHCGKVEESRPCLEAAGGGWSCGARCGRTLECGEHVCERECHAGPCGPCPLAPARVNTCPCGKKPLYSLSAKPREKCTDPIPLCGQVQDPCRASRPGSSTAQPICTLNQGCIGREGTSEAAPEAVR